MLDPTSYDPSGDDDIGEPPDPIVIDPPPIIELPPVFPSAVPDSVIGDPADSQYGDVQWGSTSCAVVAAGGVIHAMTGFDYSESLLVAKAQTQGLYDDGTIPENFGKLLDVYKIPYHVNESGAMQDIVKELAYGRKVLVAIDAPELWGKALGGWVGEVLDWIQENIWTGGNHAVWITSIDVRDPDNITVTLNDSGQPGGIGKTYSLEDFIDAAEDSRFHYVATNKAAPGTFSGSEPDPDLAAFPEIKDYYEIRYSEVLPISDTEISLAAAESITSQSEFDIEQMPIQTVDRQFLIRHAYSIEKWLQDRGLGVTGFEGFEGFEEFIREYASRSEVSLERVGELIDRHGLDVVRENYFSVHVAPDLADSLDLSEKDVMDLLRDSSFEHLYNQWVSVNFGKADNVGELYARFNELGFKTQIHRGVTYDQVVFDVQSTGGTVFAVVDMKELELGDEPLRYFVEKFKAAMRIARGRNTFEMILFVPAVVYGVVQTVEAAFDIGGNSADGLVKVHFGDDFVNRDFVNVGWPSGEEESFSHDVFRKAFEDSLFSYISLST